MKSVPPYSAARRGRLASGTQKAVSLMPSGPQMRAWKNSPSVWPDTTSITRPSTSVASEYSQRSPG